MVNAVNVKIVTVIQSLTASHYFTTMKISKYFDIKIFVAKSKQNYRAEINKQRQHFHLIFASFITEGELGSGNTNMNIISISLPAS